MFVIMGIKNKFCSFRKNPNIKDLLLKLYLNNNLHCINSVEIKFILLIIKFNKHIAIDNC